MANFDFGTILVMGVIGFALVTSVLHTLAQSLAEEQRVAFLRIRCTELRRNYTKRLDEIAGREVIEIGPAMSARHASTASHTEASAAGTQKKAA